MKIVFILSLIVALEATAPVWYSGTCGISKYPDAGTWKKTTSFGIVNGQEARPHEYPWTAAIITSINRPRPFGGAVILNERWILASGHVISYLRNISKLNETQVVVGEHRYNESNANRVYHNVSQFIVHDNFRVNKTGVDNDLALLKLETNISMSENVTPICAPDPDDFYAQRQSIVAGWGLMEGFAKSETLRFALLTVVTNAECEAGGNYEPEPMPTNQLCATDNQNESIRGPCHGDTGSPLIVKGSEAFTLIGSVSGVRKNCTIGHSTSKYMRIGNFVDWITPIVSN